MKCTSLCALDGRVPLAPAQALYTRLTDFNLTKSTHYQPVCVCVQQCATTLVAYIRAEFESTQREQSTARHQGSDWWRFN